MEIQLESDPTTFCGLVGTPGSVDRHVGVPETDRCLHEQVSPPVRPDTLDERYVNAAFRAAENHYRLSRSIFPLDVLPTATTDLGPGSLALFLGSRPGFAEDTVWFYPVFETDPAAGKTTPAAVRSG